MPHGALTVTYERRKAEDEEKICPQCAEKVKASALVCRFCGLAKEADRLQAVIQELTGAEWLN